MIILPPKTQWIIKLTKNSVCNFRLMNIIIGTLMKYKKILTTSDYNSMNNKTLFILNSIDGLWDWTISNITVII